MKAEKIHTCQELIDYIGQVGFLPLLAMGVSGWSAEEVADEDCQYTRLPDGGWDSAITGAAFIRNRKKEASKRLSWSR